MFSIVLKQKSNLCDNRLKLFRVLKWEGLQTAVRLKKLRNESDKLYLLDYTMLLRKSLNPTRWYYLESSLKRENIDRFPSPPVRELF